MSATAELRERRLNIWNDMQAILEETRADGMDGETGEKYNRLEAELNRLAADIEARERAAKIAEDLERAQSPQVEGDIHRSAETRPFVDEQRAYSRAFSNWLHGGDLSNEERSILSKGRMETRDMLVSSGAAGGYIVPEQFSNKIFEHRKYFGGVRDVAGQMTTASGGDMMWPINDDTGNVGAILAEGGTVTEQDVTFTARTFKAFKYTSKMVQVSWELMQDSAFDLESFLAKKFGERIGRIENTHMTTGTGATQPEGFVTNATTVSTATNDTTELVDIISLIYGVDRAYRINGSFMMNDAIVAHLRKKQATTGDFIWQPSAQAGEPDRLFGYPVIVNNDMASTPTTDAAKVAAFGDFSNGYMIRDVKGISVIRLNERYAESGLVAFFAIARLDAQPAYSTASSVPPFKVLLVS